MSRRSRWSWTAVLLVACLGAGGCGGGDDTTGPPREETRPLTLDLRNFVALESTTEGEYEVWVVGTDGRPRSAGRLPVSGSARDVVALGSPLSNPVEVYITVEPPGPADGVPAPQKILRGDFDGQTAELTYISAITAGLPFVEAPGSHKLFTPSDNAELGYPSNEDSGLWLFMSAPGEEGSPEFWLDFMPLRPEWTYEGWVVLDYGLPGAVWFSYGKFEIDVDKQAKFEDDTGFGPFSGIFPDYTDDPFDLIAMPGDDWVANPGGVPLPGGLPDDVLPLDLNGCAEATCRPFWRGPSRFTHVITFEPVTDKGEEPWLAQPLGYPVYRNPIGEGTPNTNRIIEYHPEDLPTGTATLSG